MTTPPNDNDPEVSPGPTPEASVSPGPTPETPRAADAGPGSTPGPVPEAGISPPPLSGDLDPGPRRRGWALWAAAAAVAAVVALAGVALAGGGDDSASGVASLDRTSRDGNDNDGSGGVAPVDESEFQDALLEYTECMRGEGVDMPDPVFQDGGGSVQIGDGGEGGPHLSPGPDESFAAADEKCGDILEDARGDMAPPDPEEIAEMQDQLVDMAECMRERGYDMPDPVVSEGGGVAIEMRGGPDSGGNPDQFEKDQAECNDQAGLDHGPGMRLESSEDDR